MHDVNVDDSERAQGNGRPARTRRTTSAAKQHRKVQLLTRDQLDGRTSARKQFDAIAHGIATDLGGEDQLTTTQKWLVEAFAGIAIHVGDCNARLMLGELVDIVEHSNACSTLVRIATRIGLQRHAKPVPDLNEYLIERENAKT